MSIWHNHLVFHFYVYSYNILSYLKKTCTPFEKSLRTLFQKQQSVLHLMLVLLTIRDIC